MRAVIGTITAVVAFALSGGRIRGRRFILIPPFTLKIPRNGRLYLGDNVLIGPYARIVTRDAAIRLGRGVFVGQNVTMVAFSELTVGDGSLIAENCSIHTENHGAAGRRDAFTSAPVTIGQDVWLGASVSVLPGTAIQDGVTVGANAVARGTLESGGTYVGVPTRRVR